MAATSRQVTDLEKVLRLLETRMTWTMGAKVLEAAALDKSRGWDESIRRCVQRTMDGSFRTRVQESLEGALARHILVGGKQVIWYDWERLSDGDRADVRRWAETVRTSRLVGEEDEFRLIETPYLQPALRPLHGQLPRLVRARRAGQRLTLLFSSARSFTTRENIDLTGMTAQQRQRFEDYLEVIGVKARIIPCFDVVVFDLAKNRVEVRMDRQPGIKSDGQDAAFSQILEHLNRMILQDTGHQPLGIGLVDFFPAVNRLYLDPSAGLVEMLGFVATSADRSSNNRGLVHRREDQDLRVDPFHVGGKNAVGTVEPYTIGVSAESLSGIDRLHLELRGNARALFGPATARSITHASFDGCATDADFDLLTSLLEDHLTDQPA